MEKLEAYTRPIGTLLAQDFFFRVPEYQRPFSWDADNFEDLIDDIASANKDQEYFLGTIVLHHRQEAGHYDIVDGQQRLTSVMILLACLRDIVADDKFQQGIQDKILQQKNVVDGIPEKIRLEVKDREIFASLVLTPGGTLNTPKESTLHEPEWRYVNAVNTFRSRLQKFSQKEIEQTILFLSQKCVVIYLATRAFADAFRLFTIVNDRGKQLRRIDILKAINIAPDVIIKDTVRNKVAHEWEQLEKGLGETTFESVFNLVRLIVLKDKPQGDLVTEFEDRIFAKKTINKGEPFFNIIFEYARLYAAIFIDKDIIDDKAPEYNTYRALIHIMDSEFSASEWRACLLYFAKRFNATMIYEFMLVLEKVYLVQWVRGVRKDERNADYAQILATIEDAKKPDDAIKGLTYDEDIIKEATQGRDLYTPTFGKYFLLRLELLTAEHDAMREFTAKSIEHVLPQTPDSSGYWADHHDLTKINEYVNTIGNLVLLSKSKNSAASNFDFTVK